MKNKALEKLIATAGSVSEFARRVNESHQNVQNWRSRGVPAKKCRRIVAEFPGVVTEAELHPEAFGEPEPAQPEPTDTTAAA